MTADLGVCSHCSSSAHESDTEWSRALRQRVVRDIDTQEVLCLRCVIDLANHDLRPFYSDTPSGRAAHMRWLESHPQQLQLQLVGLDR